MKRLFDLILSFLFLVITTPLFVVIAIGIKISSVGHIFYHQKRVGKNGSLFQIYKFRTMFNNAHKMGTTVTTYNDPRITRFGRFLRDTKLDELPQLWNVFIGEMSFVGPRPEVPEIVEKYTPEMKRILEVKPGITSIASLYLREEEKLLCLAKKPEIVYENVIVPEKMMLAMQHVDKNSFFFDLVVLIKTVWAVTFGKLRRKSYENAFYRDLVEKINLYNCITNDTNTDV